MGWIQARIEKIVDNIEEDKEVEDVEGGRLLSLVCPELPGTRDMFMDRWSTNLAQSGKHTKVEYEWKQ